jgi:voltage-gated potassium channel
MFIENQKQEGATNPISGLVAKEHSKYQPILLIFSIIVLISLFVSAITGNTKFTIIQYIVSYLFLGDFAFRFFTSDNKVAFFKKSWIDLVLCLPIYPAAWMVVTTTFRSLKAILEYVLIHIHSAFYSMLVMGAALVSFSTISILQFENIESSNIHTAWDAVWWSVCTITTVGYGDKFPVTDGGKIVAIILMICGIGLFGTLIGYLSTFFTDKEKKNNDTVDTIEELSVQISELKEIIKNQKV